MSRINNLNSWREVYCDKENWALGRIDVQLQYGLKPNRIDQWISDAKENDRGPFLSCLCWKQAENLKSRRLLKIMDRKIHATLPTKSNLLYWIYWIAPTSKQLFVEKLKIVYLCLCWAWVCKSCTIRFRPLLFTLSPYCAPAPLKRGNVRGTMLGGKVHRGDDVGGKRGRSRGNSCCVTRAGEGGSSCIVTLGGADETADLKDPSSTQGAAAEMMGQLGELQFPECETLQCGSWLGLDPAKVAALVSGGKEVEGFTNGLGKAC